MAVRSDILSFLRTPVAFCASFDEAFGAAFARMRRTGLPTAIQANGDHGLRPAQERAWDGFAGTRASLVLGPPGTGKTHLLSYLILGHVWARAEVELRSRVFISAFTRSAIENLLASLAKRAGGGAVQPRLLYLGEWNGNPPVGVEVVDLATSAGKEAMRRAARDEAVIVGGTIWKLSQAIQGGHFGARSGPTAEAFDLVAIDEASQMQLAHGLMALSGLAGDGRLIVAGDDRQLPPVASVGGFVLDGREVGGSLYAFMKQSGVPEFGLDETFRLSAPLVDFPRERFYGPSYVSAVPEARLRLRQGWEVGLKEWERLALDPDHSKVVIVHDGPPASMESLFEAEVAVRLATLLKSLMVNEDGSPVTDFWSDRLAVISPHRAQGRTIRRQLEDPQAPQEPFVETVDRIQGKERDAVILSYTVSDPEFAEMEAEFIFSPQRLNVAATRARSKLIVLVSRRLLDVVPTQQETLDKAEVLREFVFSAARVLDARIAVGALPSIAAEVRVEGFAPVAPVEAAPALAGDAKEGGDLDPRLKAILAAVVRAQSKATRGDPSLSAILKEAPLRGGERELFTALRALHGLGWVMLSQRNGPYGEFWTARPYDGPRTVSVVESPDRLAKILSLIRGSPLPYWRVRESFVWMDDERRDILRPFIDAHVRAGELRLDGAGPAERIATPEVAEAPLPDLPALADDDFRILNALEDLDAKRAAAGLFELWSHARELELATGRSAADVADAVVRLAVHGHLLQAEEGRLRSRVGELARELRHLKQRFAKDDAGARPYLVRGVKMLVRDRRKPERDKVLGDLFDRVKARSAPEVGAALMGLLAALRPIWGDNPKIAGFQERAFERIFRSWVGLDADDAFVISADTGSGKTEAVALPMIGGACVDALRGTRGTRAVLTYPRIRLAANQSQRLAKYLAALAAVPGMPTLSLGVQFGDVPSDWRFAGGDWIVAGNRCTFPLFSCPAEGCDGTLAVAIGGGETGCDRLECESCGWSYGGWVGTKKGMRENPPTFFLPTVDSLHGWLQDPAAGRIFGDTGNRPPRALMADEIHLYSHIHGAQVGYALRRLLFRCSANATDGRAPLAIGMSATLGNPARTFARLIGRRDVVPIGVAPAEGRENPRGRETFLFIQPEIESRSKDVAGAATAIQSIMCLSHGMRRRTGSEGGYRTLAFLDSIDKVRRLHSDFQDAEGNQQLARFRTSSFPDDAVTGHPIDECCGNPAGCHLSKDGECWWFAANDKRQMFADGGRWRAGKALAVANAPVWSGGREGVERMIKRSDVVFATSSLEVGYDDPDIAFVFQHYAPQNLASFIQRKGRGGRGADDRPLTAVTLSMYSPRDSYWYARPELMLDASGFDAPLNPENHFVRRAQMLSLCLDAFAHGEAAFSRPSRGSDGCVTDKAMALAVQWIEAVFGPSAWRSYGYGTLRELWEAAERKSSNPVRAAREAREYMPWVPKFLHETINLPAIEVTPLPGAGRGDERAHREDIGLLLGLAAPGNISRRFDQRVGAWRPPRDGRAPWLTAADLQEAEVSSLFDGDVAKLTSHLPIDARAVAKTGLSADLVRPTVMTFESAGQFSPIGSSWTADQCFVGGAAKTLAEAPNGQARAISHRSEGTLCGTSIVVADDKKAHKIDEGDLPNAIAGLSVFVGDGEGSATGLQLIRAYWGAEGKIVFNDPKVESEAFAQTFVDTATGLISLHGYSVESEGVRFSIDSGGLTSFVDGIMSGPPGPDAVQRQAARVQLACTSALLMAGVDRYSAGTVGRLASLAMTTPDTKQEFTSSLRRFSIDRKFRPLAERLIRERHQSDPMLTLIRANRALDSVIARHAEGVLQEALQSVDTAEAERAHLRSVILHSLALRLREMFVLVSQGDERSVSVHVKLPARFGADAEDIITIAEVGQHGDGTTRAFRDRFSDFVRLWNDGYVTACPNADEDRLVERFLAEESAHGRWLATNPRDSAGLRAIATEMGIGDEVPIPPIVTRMLFGTLDVAGRSVRLFEVYRDARKARLNLEAQLGRAATGWELSSRLVTSKDDRGGVLDDLFEWYASVPEASVGEGSLDPKARYADQIEAVGGRLCFDGCSACVRQRSEIMPASTLDASVSRSLLAGFIAASA